MSDNINDICDLSDFNHLIKNVNIKKNIKEGFRKEQIINISLWFFASSFLVSYYLFFDFFAISHFLFGFLLSATLGFLFLKMKSLKENFKLEITNDIDAKTDLKYFIFAGAFATPIFFFFGLVLVPILISHFLPNSIGFVFISVFCFILTVVFGGSAFYIYQFNVYIKNKIKITNNKYEHYVEKIKKSIKDKTSDINEIECYIEISKKNKESELIILLNDIRDDLVIEQGFKNIYEYKKYLVNKNKITVDNI